MRGWKVLSCDRKSARASAWEKEDSDQWAVTYPVNVEVFPKVEGSKLFFFATKEQAEAFYFFEENPSFLEKNLLY